MVVLDDLASEENEFDPNRFYDTAMELTGYPPEIAIFDPQLAGTLNIEWLIERAEVQELGTPAEVKSMVADRLVKVWKDRNGKQGFVPYSTRQFEVFKNLKETGRYSLSELQDIAESWTDYIEAVIVDEPPYDDRELADFDHFQRRIGENIEFFEFESQQPAEQESTSQGEIAKQRLAEWKRVGRIFLGKTEAQLGERLRKAAHRQLFHFRWQDEWTRLIMAQKFEAQILQGYSLHVSFNRMSWEAGETKLLDINWPVTLRRVSESRREGRLFPLRTPDFNLTENGVDLVRALTPEQYSEIYLRLRMEEMSAALAELGDQLWLPAPAPTDHSICPECGTPFDREAPSKIYCSDSCRKRAKNRRWREKDPERARRCQARYWKSVYRDIN